MTKTLFLKLAVLSTSLFAIVPALQAEEEVAPAEQIFTEETLTIDVSQITQEELFSLFADPFLPVICFFPQGMPLHLKASILGNLLHLDMSDSLTVLVKKDFYLKNAKEDLLVSFDKETWRPFGEEEQPSHTESSGKELTFVDVSLMTEEETEALLQDPNLPSPDTAYFFKAGLVCRPYAMLFEGEELFELQKPAPTETLTIQNDFFIRFEREETFISFDGQTWKPALQATTGSFELELIAAEGEASLTVTAEINKR